MSQEALADRAGMSVATVGRLERKDRPSCRGRTLARRAELTQHRGHHQEAGLIGR
jgi:transcriptional regulator with XRE-family HTH domain